MERLTNLLNTIIFKNDDFEFTIGHIILVFSILIIGRLVVWVVDKIILKRYFKRSKVDIGRQYAFKQLIRYVVYVLTLLIAIQATGIDISLLLAGSAALLVGIGLGLQQTFNDLISGIILLFEGAVQVGDILEVDKVVGKVTKIGLRTSTLETRDKITVVVPNSHLVTDSVVNWSIDNITTRFRVGVGVAYGSDVELVRKLLLQSVQYNDRILKEPISKVWFKDFGESSLDFEVLFWSSEIFPIEEIKSEVRYEIDRLFREHNVAIPFPQRDLHIKSGFK